MDLLVNTDAQVAVLKMSVQDQGGFEFASVGGYLKTNILIINLIDSYHFTI